MLAHTMLAFGHDKVSVLDGGLPRWIHEGEEVDTGDVGDVGRSEYIKAEGPNPDLVRCERGLYTRESGRWLM